MKKLKKLVLILVLSLVLVFGIKICINEYEQYAQKASNYIDVIQLKAENENPQMMSYLIKTKNGKVIMIDGGNAVDSTHLQGHINECGGKVDYWFLTHFHQDHTGAICEIIDNTNIEISNIVADFCDRELVEKYEAHRLNQYDRIVNSLENSKVKDKIIIPTESQIFEIDNLKIKILSLYKDDIFENLGNNTSMVFKLYINDKSFLVLGDLGAQRCLQVMNECLEELDSDYVQMAHHGQNGVTYEFYEAVSPEYCLWPTPEWLWNNDNGGGYNSGPWKTLETREWIEKLDVEENYIAKDGDKVIRIF